MRTRITQRAATLILAILFCTQAIAPQYALATSKVPSKSESVSTSSVPVSSGSDSVPNSLPTGSESSLESSSATADSSSSITSEGTSTSDSISTSSPQSLPTKSDSETTSSSASSATSESAAPEEKPNEPLAIASVTESAAAAVGKSVTLCVRLNRMDVAVLYQWQRLAAPEEATDLFVKLNGNDAELAQTYYLPIAGMTEAELLALNPEATWPGKEMWDAAVATANGDVTIHFENGTPVILDAQEPSAPEWNDIADAEQPDYTFTVAESDTDARYRCVVTPSISVAKESESVGNASSSASVSALEERTPPASNDSAAQSMSLATQTASHASDFQSDAAAEELTNTEKPLISPEMSITVDKSSLRTRMRSYDAPDVTLQDGWLVGVGRDMEYITADAYNRYNADAVGNANWTKLAGGTRTDGTTYLAQSLSLKTEQYRMTVLSAWYGKTIYVRRTGYAGSGTTIEIPAYTDRDYTTGKKTLYKKAISVLSVRVPETGVDFYSIYLDGITNPSSRELIDGKGAAIAYTTVPLTPNSGQYLGISFNEQPERYLKDAEGNYRFDSVMIGVNVYVEPDLSGKAAWALKDYMAEGYGVMTGHDMMYGYGGVTSADYVPDKNSTATPYYELNTSNNGHWNMNWLMGTNKLYTEASPYEAASLVLCSGSWVDKSTLYGDNYGFSTVRVNAVVPGNVDADISIRCPTNYPYGSITITQGQTSIEKGTLFETNSTHSNQQIAYGTVWLDFASNSMMDSGSGQLITDTRGGLTGTNNFYCTTNGNLALNQIGHRVTGQAAGYAELQMFANTILYISQRQQCQVCQSEQGGNGEIHFVHRVSSVEQLAQLKDQNKYWYTMPMDGCYILTSDLRLPKEWSSIEDFYGHFHANGYNVTLGANGAPLFANDVGTLGECNATAKRSWNLGTDKTAGINAIVGSSGQRTTGSARVSGFLGTLFGTDNTEWAGKIVTIEGTDGTLYTCKTNADGKYVLANLPCTGVMKAHVYDTSDANATSSANEVTRYGPIRVNVPDTFWNTDETTVLYLLGFTPIPVENHTLYESESAAFVEGGVYWPQEVTDITWQYQTPGSTSWSKFSSSAPFTYTVDAPVFHELGKDSYTTTSFSLSNAAITLNKYRFRAVFRIGASMCTTDDKSTVGREGLLTVLPIPLYVESPEPQNIWLDSDATFTSSCEAAVGTDNGLTVQWQVRRYASDPWTDVNSYPELSTKPTTIAITSEITEGTTDRLCPVKTTSTLTVACSGVPLSDLQFRTLYAYTHPLGEVRSKATEDAILTVMPPKIDAVWVEGQSQRKGLTFENPLICDLATGVSTEKAVYEADVFYLPGQAETAAGTPSTEVYWKYKTLTSPVPIAWNQDTANALATKLGVVAPSVSITSAAPEQQADGSYKVHTKMEISNVSWKLYSEDCFLFFLAGATNHYKTVPYASISGETETMPLFVDFKVGIKWNDGLQSDKGAYSEWRYPNMTVDSNVGVKTLLLYFDKSLQPNFDGRDAFKFGAVPLGMKVGISNPHYVMFVSDTAVSAETVQNFLRTQMSVLSYDVGVNPKLRAYINADKNMGATGISKIRSYAGNLSVAWTNDNMEVGGSAAAYASGSAPYMQWQVKDSSGVWQDCLFETNPTFIIGNLYGNMENWAFRLQYGNSAADFKVSNEISIQYSFKITIPQNSFASHGEDVSWTAQGNVVNIPTAYASRVTKVTFVYSMNSEPGSFGVFGSGDVWFTYHMNGVRQETRKNDNPWNASTDRGWKDYTETITKYVSGLYTLQVECGNTATGYSYPAVANLHSIVIEGGRSPGGSSEGVIIKRSEHEAWDITTVWHQRTQEPQVVAATQATGKVYDGIEVNALVNLVDATGILTSMQLVDIMKNGTLQYSNGTVTHGNPLVGSGCVDVGRYTATFVPASGDAKYFASNSSDEIRQRTAAFEITQRPVKLYSFDNNKAYDGTDFALVKDIKVEAYDAGNGFGVIPKDSGKIFLNKTAFIGKFKEDVHQTNGVQAQIFRQAATALHLTGEKAINYRIAAETYTGAITPRPLAVHSLYLDAGDNDGNPRNVKQYDNTDAAVITKIIIDNIVEGDDVWVDKSTYQGAYASAQAGETLQDDGTAQENRLMLLWENNITREEDIALIHNEHGDYAIASEQYSGAISRRVLQAQVATKTILYGDVSDHIFTTLPKYTSKTVGIDAELSLSQLMGDDMLVIDAKKSEFFFEENLQDLPDAGFYPVSYNGLTEKNYPVLSNYILLEMPGGVEVLPRPLTITVAGGYQKREGDENPKFDVTYSGFVKADTPKNALQGTLEYVTECTKESEIQKYPDGRDAPYLIYANGLECRKNKNGTYNYELTFVEGTIILIPRLPETPDIGTIHLYKPAHPDVVARDPITGAILFHTLKPFPKTGVSISGDVLTNKESISLPIGQEASFTMPQTLRNKGGQWQLMGIEILRADGLRGDETKAVTFEGLEAHSVPKTYLVENGALMQTLYLSDVTYEQSEPSALDVCYSNALAKPQPPSTMRREVDGAFITYTLESIEETGTPSWRTIEIPTYYYGDVGYRFLAGTAEVPYGVDKPVFSGYEDVLLSLIHSNEKKYRMGDSRWTSEGFVVSKNGEKYRSGVYVATIFASDWTVHYKTNENTRKAIAFYTANGNKTAVDYIAIGTYTQQSILNKLFSFPMVIVTLLSGVLLVIGCVVMILFRLAKKRKREKTSSL